MTRWWLSVACVLLPVAASAQVPIDRFEIAFGGRWFMPVLLDTSSATLTAADGQPVVLFTTRTELLATPAVETRVGLRLTSAVYVEAAASLGFTRLRTRVTDDIEDVPDLEVSEAIRRVSIGGALVAEIGPWRMGPITPFLTAGGAYFRQIHEGRPVIDEGRTLHAGGGVNYVMRTGAGWTGRQNAVGLRFDAHVIRRTGGIAFNDDPHMTFAGGGSLFFRF